MAGYQDPFNSAAEAKTLGRKPAMYTRQTSILEDLRGKASVLWTKGCPGNTLSTADVIVRSTLQLVYYYIFCLAHRLDRNEPLIESLRAEDSEELRKS